MKNIFRIFVSDVKKIFGNRVAVFVVVAICVLPSLYARFYLKSSRDPYGNTKWLKVAVVNNDEWVVFEWNYINIWKEVVDWLKENDQIGRVFVTESVAQEWTELGNYYANIVIESGFSQKFITFLDDEPQNPKLYYTVNEKINAIVPKITDQWASSIRHNIEESFTRTVNEVAMEKLNDVWFFLQKDKSNIYSFIDVVHKINKEVSGLNSFVDNALNWAYKTRNKLNEINWDFPSVYDTVDDTQDLLSDTMNLSQDTIDLLDSAPSKLKKDMSNIRSSLDTLDNDVSNVISMADKENDKIQTWINVVLWDISKIRWVISGQKSTLEDVKSRLQGLTWSVTWKVIAINVVDDLISKYDAVDQKLSWFNSYLLWIESGLDNWMNTIKKNQNNIKSSTKKIRNDIDDISRDLDRDLIPDLDNTLQQIYNLSSKWTDKLNKLENDLPDVEAWVNSWLDMINTAIDRLEELKRDLPSIQWNISSADSSLQKIKNDWFINKILDVALLDPGNVSDFFTAPIELVENKLFSIPNYWSAMSPFFTPLAIWIWVLLMIAMFSTRKVDKKYSKCKNIEKFFGKWLLFLWISIVQWLIVSLWEVWMLWVYVADFRALMISVICCSIVFSMIMFSLVWTFWNAWKWICVIFLVLQLSWSGWTFPVEMTDSFFQTINPFLPFTYAIRAIRESIWWIVPQIFWSNISVLFWFFVLFVLIWLIASPYTEKWISKFDKKFAELDIAE